jgi:hypothetical protein
MGPVFLFVSLLRLDVPTMCRDPPDRLFPFLSQGPALAFAETVLWVLLSGVGEERSLSIKAFERSIRDFSRQARHESRSENVNRLVDGLEPFGVVTRRTLWADRPSGRTE